MQPWPNFSGNYIIPFPQLYKNQKQKQVFAEKWSVFSAKSGEDQKKRSSPQFETIFGRNLLDIFVLAGSCSFYHPALKSRWGTSKSRWGDANPHVGTRFPASPHRELASLPSDVTAIRLWSNHSHCCCCCSAYLSSCHRTASDAAIGQSVHVSLQ